MRIDDYHTVDYCIQDCAVAGECEPKICYGVANYIKNPIIATESNKNEQQKNNETQQPLTQFILIPSSAEQTACFLLYRNSITSPQNSNTNSDPTLKITSAISEPSNLSSFQEQLSSDNNHKNNINQNSENNKNYMVQPLSIVNTSAVPMIEQIAGNTSYALIKDINPSFSNESKANVPVIVLNTDKDGKFQGNFKISFQQENTPKKPESEEIAKKVSNSHSILSIDDDTISITEENESSVIRRNLLGPLSFDDLYYT